MEVIYNNKRLNNNNYLSVIETQEQPDIKYEFMPNNYYTLIMYDPNAVNGNYIHWLIINIKSIRSEEDGDIIFTYKGPAPPKGTGIHNYIFEIYIQNNKIDVNNISLREINSREMSLNNIKNILDIVTPLEKIQFISVNEEDKINKNGGRKLKRKKSRFRKTISKNSRCNKKRMITLKK